MAFRRSHDCRRRHRRGVRAEAKALADPLIDLSLFKSVAFSASLAINIVGFFVAFGTFLFIAQCCSSCSE